MTNITGTGAFVPPAALVEEAKSNSMAKPQNPVYVSAEYVSKYSDVTIVCEDGESFVRGVRCLLAALSPDVDRLMSGVKPGGQVKLPISFQDATKLATGGADENANLIRELEDKLNNNDMIDDNVIVAEEPVDGEGSKKGEKTEKKSKSKKYQQFLQKAPDSPGSSSSEADLNSIVSSLWKYVKDSVGTKKAESKGVDATPPVAPKRKIFDSDAGTGSSNKSGWSFPTLRLSPTKQAKESSSTLLTTKESKTILKKEQAAANSLFAEDAEDHTAKKQDSLIFWAMQALVTLVCIPPWYAVWYYNLDQGGFFMDDVMIKRNKNVTDPEFDVANWLRTDYWGLDMFDPAVWTHKSFRPITVLSFRFDYQNFSFDSSAFHRHNLLLHFTAGLMCGWCVKRLLKMSNAFAALLSFFFLTHPVHTESLCYIVGRADLQCLIVIITAVLAYDQMLRLFDRNIVSHTDIYQVLGWSAFWMHLCFALIVVAGLCKETGFTSYGLLILLEGYYVIKVWDRSKASKVLCGGRVAYIFIMGIATCIWRVRYTDGTTIERMDPYSNPIAAHDETWPKVLSYWFVHGSYAELLVWPRWLCYDYSMDAVPLLLSAKDVRLLLPACSYVTLLVSFFFTMRWFYVFPTLAKASGFGLMVFALAFMPMSNIFFPVGTLIAERLLYIPSFGYLLVLNSFMSIGWNYSGKLWKDKNMSGKKQALLIRGVIVLFILAQGLFYYIRCYYRALDWKDMETITYIDGLKQWKSGRTQFNLGNLYLARKEYDEAEKAYQRAIESDPDERDAMPLYHAGQIDIYYGRWDTAEARLQKAVSGYFSPLTLAEEEVFHDYGMALWHTQKPAESIYNLQASVITNPKFAKAYGNLACAQTLYGMDMGDEKIVNQGLTSLEQAITLAPDMALYWRNAASLLQLVGDAHAAQGAWEKFQVMDPSAQGQPIPDNCVWEFYFR